jgi:serine/threonine protein kinase
MVDSLELSIGEGLPAASGVLYRTIQRLGMGGNAVTYLVVAITGAAKGVPFALKVFRRLSKPERRDAFLQEIEFLKTCEHPSIMRVFDTGVYHDEYPFVVAEYLPDTLRTVIARGTTPITPKIAYTLQLLSALDYLANLAPAVVHRDIKPENMFLKGHSCVLGDFGLMKRVGTPDAPDQTVLKESVGAGMPWSYRTPDLVTYYRREGPITSKSDIFQLGLVVAELFTGKNPLRPHKTFADPVELNRLSGVHGALAEPILDLIGHMLVIDPEDRDPAAKFVDAWQGVFFDAIERAHALEGRVF